MTRIQEANRIWCGKTAKPKPIQTAKNQRSSETQYLENDKKEMSGLEMEIIRVKKINVKDREHELEKYWKKLIERHVKHDLSRVDLKTAEIYKQSIILLNILKNNETGAVIAALESDEKREHSRRISDMCGQETYIML